ncbi:hypothetical protein ACT4UT_37385, partial [Bacillus sp. B-TM1]
MEIIFTFICIILVASILQTSTGFGFSIMATPFLLMSFPLTPTILPKINLFSRIKSMSVLIFQMSDM